ncbi:DUF2515 family protein [Mesobacillus zeae]|uniref:DUF2515 domain-containing protein n=1 Tax=Mesobacillus zeae TaxID=1917180 RepID=A0A398B967_9BACI|nr:DUF2515 family protein [Mesobacillus zeae]RID84213.1 DUF2515 domain-containing protein [Mesobacillus zeae]
MSLKPPHLTSEEAQLIRIIRKETSALNIDNISRTAAYLEFYLNKPDMIWAFLASMVSRNGGYNMCDLEGDWFPRLIGNEKRRLLFFAYERANWLIFRDAYSQLLLYKYSTKFNRPLFHLLRHLDVSEFMEKEWYLYWNRRNRKRLLTALIINEQNVIHNIVIKHHLYRKKVFRSSLFSFQDFLHFSSVLLPTREGELYGASVNGFRSLHKRINLGKRLASILFDPEHYPRFLDFAITTEHTGSRYDYEQYFHSRKKKDTPFLRCTFPIIEHHFHSQKDWYSSTKFHKSWIEGDVRHIHPIKLTHWFTEKQRSLHMMITLGELSGFRL